MAISKDDVRKMLLKQLEHDGRDLNAGIRGNGFGGGKSNRELDLVMLEAAVDKLSFMRRKIIHMLYFEGMSRRAVKRYFDLDDRALNIKIEQAIDDLWDKLNAGKAHEQNIHQNMKKLLGKLFE